MNGISSAIQNSAAASVWQPPAQQPASLLGQLKGLFVTPDSNAAHVDSARQSFEQYFLRETSALADMMGAKGIEGFASDVQTRFDSIVQRTFDALARKDDGSVAGKDFANAMKSAGKQAVMALDRLKVDAARAELLSNLGPVDTRPQIIPRGDKFVVIRPAPQLENMVLRGGGAKGIGYSAGLDQLEKAGMLAGVKHLAGSSAGALTATCLAAGLNAAQFEKGPADALFRPGMLDALKGGADAARIYPGVRMEGGLAPAFASLKVIDQTTAQSVRSYLTEHWNTPAFQDRLVALADQGRLDDRQLARLSLLQQTPDFDQPHEDNMVTFGDLKLLNQLAPDKFKQLTLTGWGKTPPGETYFDADTHPDMPVAYAARISMAFPIAFKAVSIETAEGGRKVYADGGIGSNMPSEVFTRPVNAHGVRVPLAGPGDGAGPRPYPAADLRRERQGLPDHARRTAAAAGAGRVGQDHLVFRQPGHRPSQPGGRGSRRPAQGVGGRSQCAAGVPWRHWHADLEHQRPDPAPGPYAVGLEIAGADRRPHPASLLDGMRQPGGTGGAVDRR